jgi:hypothetical protein
MANYDWMDPNLTPIGGATAAGALGNPWLTALGAMGQMGAGMLQGTDKQWLGAPGAVAGNVAKNIQAGDVNKDQLATLMTLAKALQDPVMKGAKIVSDKDGKLSISMDALAGSDQQAMNQPAPVMRPTTPGIEAQKSLTQQVQEQPIGGNLAREGAAGLGNSPFLSALHLWK